MAFVNMRVVSGVLDEAEKRRMVEGKGNEDFRQYCWVILDKIEPGMLGVGGQGLTTEDVKQAQG